MLEDGAEVDKSSNFPCIRPADCGNYSSLPVDKAVSGEVRDELLADALKNGGWTIQGRNAVDFAADIARKYGINPDVFIALIQIESSWNKDVRSSRTGCRGLMQMAHGPTNDLINRNWGFRDSLKLEEALRERLKGKAIDGGADDPRNDHAMNLELAGAYIANLLHNYEGDYMKAIQAFNWGMGCVDAYIGRRKRSRAWIRKYCLGRDNWKFRQAYCYSLKMFHMPVTEMRKGRMIRFRGAKIDEPDSRERLQLWARGGECGRPQKRSAERLMRDSMLVEGPLLDAAAIEAYRKEAEMLAGSGLTPEALGFPLADSESLLAAFPEALEPPILSGFALLRALVLYAGKYFGLASESGPLPDPVLSMRGFPGRRAEASQK